MEADWILVPLRIAGMKSFFEYESFEYLLFIYTSAADIISLFRFQAPEEAHS